METRDGAPSPTSRELPPSEGLGRYTDCHKRRHTPALWASQSLLIYPSPTEPLAMFAHQMDELTLWLYFLLFSGSTPGLKSHCPSNSRALQPSTLKTELITHSPKLPSPVRAPSQPRCHLQPLRHSKEILYAVTRFQAPARHRGGSSDTGQLKSLPSRALVWFSTLSDRTTPF